MLPSCLGKTGKCMKSTYETPVDFPALRARASIPGLYGSITIRKTILGRLPPLRHGIDSRLKYTPSIPVKKNNLLVLELQPEGQVSGLSHI